jgi:uncharacterized protein (DUF58 family)
MVLAGASFGWFELTVAGLIGCAALVLASAFLFGRSSYAVSLDLAQNRVVVGERALGKMLVGNASERPILPARIEMPVGSALAVFPVPLLGRGAEHEELFTIPTQRRGVIAVGPLRAVRGDALGLLARVVRFTDPVDLYVHPRTVRLAGSTTGFLKDLEGRPTEELSNSDISFRTLRDYVPGDDRRYIHWKTTARTDTLMVRQVDETRRSHLAIGLSVSGRDYGSADEFELAVSACASLGLQSISEARDLTVLTQAAPIASVTGMRMLDQLSGVETRESYETIQTLSTNLARAVPGASVAALVFGSTVTPAQVNAAASAFPLGVRVVAISCGAKEAPTRRIAGDLVFITAGSLDDLPTALRRVA